MYDIIDYVLKKQLELLETKHANDCTYIGFISDDDLDWIDGVNAALMFGRVKYQRNEDTFFWKPMMLKLTPQVINFPEFHVYTFINEAYFFTRVLPFFEKLKPIQPLFPKYITNYVEMGVSEDKYLLVFESLKQEKYHRSPRRSCLDLDHLKMMMRKLGQLHAYSYEAARQNRDHFISLMTSFKDVFFTSIRKMQGLLTHLSMRGLDPLRKDATYSSKLEKLEVIIENADSFVNDVFSGEVENPLSVLCHGLYIEENVLFQYEQGKPVNMKFVDLTAMKLASPIVDLASALYMHTDQKTRDEHWDELVDDYYTSLKNTFPEAAPSKNEILKEFTTKAVVAYLLASFTLCRKISLDEKTPGFSDLLPHEFKGFGYSDIPLDVLIPIMKKVGGDAATNALSDILRDMIDRGFA